MKDGPPWQAKKGSLSWRKYGLANMTRGQLEIKKWLAAKSELGSLHGDRSEGVKRFSAQKSYTGWMGRSMFFGKRGRGMKLGLGKCSQADVERETTKSSEKAVTNLRRPQELQLKKANQEEIDNSKKIWLTMPNIYGQGQGKWVSSSHCIYQLGLKSSFSRDKDIWSKPLTSSGSLWTCTKRKRHSLFPPL